MLLRFAALAAFAATCFWGQSTDAALGGTVFDASGAIVPAAKLLAVNVETGVENRSVSNEAGSFLFQALTPGRYRLTAEKEGFRKAQINQVELAVGARIAIDVRLELGSVAEVVEVTADGQTALGYVTSSVGGVVNARRILDLPQVSRNALDYVLQQAGVLGDNFAGARIGNLNVQMDGINVMDARINLGVNSTIFASVDRVQEFRVVTQPVDAELGRGSGQVQAITRGGTNEFRGSVWNFHRNTILNANTWFNNQRGRDIRTGNPVSPRENLIRNQYGARLGGPVIKNKTFFHFLYEGQTVRTKDSIATTVLTPQARAGQFRFFPGVQNGNAASLRPTVDGLGNPVPPTPGATLNTINLYSFDPSRARPDPSGQIQKMLDLMPLPNNFLLGDGLNTAGFAWNRGSATDENQYALKIDHNLSDKHRLAFSLNLDRSDQSNGFMAQPFPGSPGGNVQQRDSLYSITLTSTLTPNVVNEFRYGALRPRFRFFSPWEVSGTTALPTSGNNPYLIDFLSVTDPIDVGNDPQGRLSPNYQFFDKVSWIRGKHNYKLGGQVWFVSTNGFNSFTVMPRSNIGQGGVSYGTLPSAAGIGQNIGLAQNLLANLSGSAASVQQALNAPGGPNPQFLPGETKNRLWKAPEFALFFQDDWKATKRLTLNLGVRYEYYGVPIDRVGRTAGVVGGSAGIFGISGTDASALFRPGLNEGRVAGVELVGPNTSNPGRRLYNRDWNNWTPIIGLSYQLPFSDRYSTSLRAGYSRAYERQSLRLLDVVSGDQPGLRELVTRTSSALINQTNLGLPLPPIAVPLATVPLTDRTQILRAYDSGLKTPVVHNFNFSIDQALPGKSLLSVRYVGSLGRQLLRGADQNEHNIYETGILQAFQQVQGGVDSPLMNRIFQGLNVGGRVVDGTTWTATQALQAATQTQGFFAQSNVGGFASYLNNTDNFTGTRGGLIRRAGLPENWIVVNPQFASSRLFTNFAGSTYHSLQLEWVKRFTTWTLQSNYTFAKAIGEEEGAAQEILDSYRTLRNRSLDKRLLSFSNHHVIRNNAIYELPFGKKQKFFNSANGFVDRLIGGWQVGVIYNIFSGTPIPVLATGGTVNNFGDNTAMVSGPISRQFGEVVKGPNGVNYFTGITQTPDPQVASLTGTPRTLSSLRAIRSGGADGPFLFQNPVPGVLGNLAPRSFYGPGSFRLDLNMIKRIRITERISVQIDFNAQNALNSPIFNSPTAANLDINSLNFGQITGGGGTRIIFFGGRINF